MSGIRRLGVCLSIVRNSLHALFETAQSFAKTFAKLRQLTTAEEEDSDQGHNNQVPRLKDLHIDSPFVTRR